MEKRLNDKYRCVMGLFFAKSCCGGAQKFGQCEGCGSLPDTTYMVSGGGHCNVFKQIFGCKSCVESTLSENEVAYIKFKERICLINETNTKAIHR